MLVKRGDIFYADLSPVVGSEQGGLRPVLIVQNDVGNRYSPTVIAAAITSKTGKTKLPTHIDVLHSVDSVSDLGLARDSVILLEQIRTIDKRRLREHIGHLDDYTMHKVNTAISVSFGISDGRDGRGGDTEIYGVSASRNGDTEIYGVSANSKHYETNGSSRSIAPGSGGDTESDGVSVSFKPYETNENTRSIAPSSENSPNSVIG